MVLSNFSYFHDFNGDVRRPVMTLTAHKLAPDNVSQLQDTYSATYESSGHQFFERGQEFYTRFVGARATLHVFQRWLILCANGKLPRVIRRGPRKVTEEQLLLQQFERALLHGETAEVCGRDNLQTMAVVEACLRSAAGQTWINPQELLNGSS